MRRHRLGLLIEVDELGVTTVLQVGNPASGPTRLVVADEPPIRIRGQGRFTGAREAAMTLRLQPNSSASGTTKMLRSDMALVAAERVTIDDAPTTIQP